ncbi:phage tail spike protein [Bacillus paramycoides]|uniref:phage tail spike protein n=1 Tax=Bacillus paramycoides TaxID=2026194 RepID=UPI003808ABAD
MRTPSGTLHVVDFQTEQIVSAIQSKDYRDDKRHWEIKNNIDTLEFKVFDNTEHAATLMQQNLVLKEVRDGRIVPYVITEVEKDSDDRSVITYASGEWIQLAKSGIINPQKLEGKTVNELLDMALVGTKWKRGETEYSGFHSMTIDEFIDPLSFLKKIASLFELEIQYRAEVVGSQIVGRYVDMVKKRGRETGKEVTLGKDLMGIKRIENSQNICTALLGFVKKEGGDFIIISSINNGVPYLVDNDAFQRWNERGQHKFGFYTPETEEDITPQRLMTLMKTEHKKRVNTSVSYEVQAQSIGRVFGLSHELINEGDTIRIKDTGFTPKLYLEARAIAGDESYKDPTQDKYVFGDYREIVDANEELRKMYNKIIASLGDKQALLDQLDKLVKETSETASNAQKESETAKALAQKVQENLKNYQTTIIESKTAPTTGLEPGKTLWLDISNGKPGILKLWKNGIWDPVVPDVDKVKKETLDQVNKDIESTKTELNQKVQTVENKAKEIAGQVADVAKEVGNKVDQTWINNRLKDKADKSGVYTKDEIKDGFIGKQIYETDKQGNVKKFQDINTSIGQTNEALTQKAEKSELKTISNNVVEVTKTVNETKQMAEGTKESLSQVTSKVDNSKVAERNVITNSNFSTGDATSWTVMGGGSGIVEQAVDIPEFAYCGKLTRTNSTADLWFLKDIKVTPGQYIISAFFKSSNLTMAMGIRDGSTTPTYKIVSLPKDLTDGKWHHVKLEVEFKTNEARIYFGTQKNKETTGEMFITGTKLAEGTVFSTWSPAPEDQLTNNEFTKKTVEIEKNINGVTTSVSNIQNEQGKLTERVTKSEQTADGFKQNIESLNRKDNEITNKLNTVESTVEGTKKMIADVQSDTTALKKTTTEITEQAGKISEKLTNLETREVRVRNYAINSDFSNDKNGWSGITNPVTTKIIDVTIPGVPEIKKGLQLTSNAAFITQILKAEPFVNKKGIASCYVDVKAVTSITEFPRLYMRFTYDQNGKEQQYYAIIQQKEVTNGWKRISIPFDTTKYTGNLKEVRINIATGNTTTADATFTGILVTFGDYLENWNLAPEDGVSQGAFQEKTTEIIKSVDGIKENITKVEQNQTGFDKRVTDVEKNANGISQNVSKLQETQTQQGKQISEAQTTIKQHSDALDLTVKMKDVEGYVGGIGSTNEVRDAPFRQDFKYWARSNGNTVIDKQVTYKGFSSIRTITQGETADKYWGGMSNLTEVSPGEDMVDSAYFYTDDPASIDRGVALQLEFFDASGGRILFPSTPISLLKGVWTRFFVTAKVPAGAVKARLRYHLNRNGRIWMALPMLQRGTTPSSFMENPNDIVGKDKIMDDIADKVATEKYNQKVTELERSITANADGVSIISKKHETFVNDTFDAYVKQTGSKLQVLDEGILAEVKKGNIIAAINFSSEKLVIDVSKVNINADTMVKWLTAKGIDTNIINVNGDKITIDKNGVTVKMLDFLFQDEWGTKTTAVSRRNLIADPDFSSVGKKNIGNADYYGFEGGYGLTWKSQGNVVIEKNTSVFDYEQMINAARVDLYNYPEAVVNNGIHPGNEYTVSAHFRASMINGVRKTAKPRLHVCCVKFKDSVSYDIWNEQKMDFPEPSIFYGEIRRYSFTFKVPTNYKPQEHALIIKVCSANGQISAGTAVCVSGVTLYSGKYASMYNWDRAAAERAAGIQPFNSISVGGVNNNIGLAPDGQTFDISTENEVKFIRNIRAVQGVNLGGNAFQGWGHIRFTDGSRGVGFYVNNSNGWHFNALG